MLTFGIKPILGTCFRTCGRNAIDDKIVFFFCFVFFFFLFVCLFVCLKTVNNDGGGGECVHQSTCKMCV